MEAGERDSCRSTSAAMLEFSSGNLMPEWFCPPVLLWLFPPPPFPPPPHPLWLLAFRECRLGGATDELGGEDEGVPGDPAQPLCGYRFCPGENNVPPGPVELIPGGEVGPPFWLFGFGG